MDLEITTKLRVAVVALAAGMVGVSYVSADTRSAADSLGLSRGSGYSTVQINFPEAIAGQKAGEAAHAASLTAGPRVTRDLTVLIYMNGKNNLGVHHGLDIFDMEQAGSNARMNVVVEKGSLGRSMYGQKWTGARRFYIRKNPEQFPLGLVSEVLDTLPDADMGDWHHVAEFVRWGKAAYPARRYVLVISDHGSGLFDIPRAVPPEGGAKGISYDDATGSSVSNLELAALLRETGGVDALVLDACLMQALEIAYEVRDYAPYVVASQEVSWTDTISYSRVLAALGKTPAAPAEALARAFIEASRPLWASDRVHQKMSLVRTGELPALLPLLDAWTRLARAHGDAAALRAARLEVMRFEDPWSSRMHAASSYADLYDFTAQHDGRLNLSSPGAAQVKAAGEALRAALAGRAVALNATYGYNTSGRAMSDARGLSIYVPPPKVYRRAASGKGGKLVDAAPADQAALEARFANPYSDYAFARDCAWREFTDFLWRLE
ncbi:MAG: Clostripain family [Elusimicrobia bacterium]|nr:MAG: Clostripain family [Elusimicrobiota bacterium]KAF0151875.1 MAG: Clostripain family [Elusimicrobiota bacterium]